MQTCSSIEGLLREKWLERLVVKSVGENLCIASLPMSTVDNRQPDVFIEARAGDYLLVHEGGKSFNELILSGHKGTEAVERSFHGLAQQFGILWQDQSFQMPCKLDRLPDAVLAISSASLAASVFLLERIPEETSNSTFDALQKALKQWAKSKAKLKERVKAQGAVKQHQFDFVLTPTAGTPPIGVTILSPGNSSISAAERYAFKLLDLKSSNARNWAQLVVQTSQEEWSNNARKIITKMADGVIEVPAGQQPGRIAIDQKLEMLLLPPEGRGLPLVRNNA
jgi:hypothetical protein